MSATSTLEKGNALKDTLVNCLTQQLSEYELLKSMYPENDDIVLSDPKVLEEIENFFGGSSDYTPPHLDFILNIFVDKIKLEVCINLPSFYPDEEPDVYVRCNQLNRYQESNLNSELSTYLSKNFLGDVCLYSGVSWLQDNFINFINKDINEARDDSPTTVSFANKDDIVDDDKFFRYWIHSHHIYNKKKRDEIVNKAKDLTLTGFCLPGKPGIICIEGTASNCKEWWRIIKSMTWKKITIRNMEVFERNEMAKQQKFYEFKEIHFPNNSSKHGKHADMSELSKYMGQHGLLHVFNDLFGIFKDI